MKKRKCNIKEVKTERKHKWKNEKEADLPNIPFKKRKRFVINAKNTEDNINAKRTKGKEEKNVVEQKEKITKKKEKNPNPNKGIVENNEYFRITKTQKGNKFSIKYVSTDSDTNLNAKKGKEKDEMKKIGIEKEKGNRKSNEKEKIITEFLEELNKLNDNEKIKKSALTSNIRRKTKKDLKKNGLITLDNPPKKKAESTLKQLVLPNVAVSKINKKITSDQEKESILSKVEKKKKETKKVKNAGIQKKRKEKESYVNAKHNNKKNKIKNKETLPEKPLVKRDLARKKTQKKETTVEKNANRVKKNEQQKIKKDGEKEKTNEVEIALKQNKKRNTKQAIIAKTTNKVFETKKTIAKKIEKAKPMEMLKKMKRVKNKKIMKNKKGILTGNDVQSRMVNTTRKVNTVKEKKKQITERKEKEKEKKKSGMKKQNEQKEKVKTNGETEIVANRLIQKGGMVTNKIQKDDVEKKRKIKTDVEKKEVEKSKYKAVKEDMIQKNENNKLKNLEKEEREEEKQIEKTIERYEDLHFKSDVYQISENKGKIEISDLLTSTDKNTVPMNTSLQLLKNVNMQVEEDEDISQYKKEKINAQLAYEKKIEDINGYKYAISTLRAADAIEFGKPEEIKEGLFDLCKNNVYKYQYEQYEQVKNKITEASGKNEQMDTNMFNKERKTVENSNLDNELLQLYNLSNKNKLDDAKLNEQKKMERNKTVMKIAALKRSLFNEQQKNAYKKKIKSKGYRKFIRNQDKNLNQKILDKLKNHYPDLSDYITKCEEEYAKMRNMGKREKSQKILKTLRKYKNEAIKKVVLKNIQEEREEKHALKEIIKKELGSSSSDGTAEDETTSSEEENVSSEEKEEGVEGENKRIHKIDKELEKRDLLKYKFIQKGRELREEEEKEKMAKRKFLKQSNKIKDHFDEEYFSDISDSSDNYYADRNIAKEKTEMGKKQTLFSEEVLKKKTDTLLNNVAFMNSLKKAGILDTNVLLEDDDEEVAKVEEVKKGEDVEKVEEATDAEEATGAEEATKLKEVAEVEEQKEVSVLKKEHNANNLEEPKKDILKEVDKYWYVERVVENEKHIDSEKEEECNTLREEMTNKKDKGKNKGMEGIEEKYDTKVEHIRNDNESDIKKKVINTSTVADINAIDGEEFLKKCTSGTTVYNFENNVIEKYININDEEEIKKEREEEIELSDSEKVQSDNIKINEWTNLNTIIENEKKKKKKEQEIIEKKRNIPFNSITVYDKPDKLFSKYYVNKLPHSHVEEEYEKSLNIMISKELNDPKCFRHLIEPKITSRYGQIIEPLRKSINKLVNILKGKKDKRKPNF